MHFNGDDTSMIFLTHMHFKTMIRCREAIVDIEPLIFIELLKQEYYGAYNQVASSYAIYNLEQSRPIHWPNKNKSLCVIQQKQHKQLMIVAQQNIC